MKKAVSWLLLFLLVFAAPAQAAMFMRNCALEQSLYRENHPCSHNGGYGTTTQTSGDHGLYQPMLYTHCELDAETGFYHNSARHYAPKFGKFLARDPIASNNLYSYCHGDPINHRDTSGLNELDVLLATLAAEGVKYSQGVFTILRAVAPEIVADAAAVGGVTEAGAVAPALPIIGIAGIAYYAKDLPANIIASRLFPVGIPSQTFNWPVKSWGEARISPYNAHRIQQAATRSGVKIRVVGSRCFGTSGPDSDWDYVVYGNQKARKTAKIYLPRGAAGGATTDYGHATGIDIFSPSEFRPELPYVEFSP